MSELITFIILLVALFQLSAGASQWNNPYTRGRAIESFILGTVLLLMVVFV